MLYLLPKGTVKDTELEQLAKKASVGYEQIETLRDFVLATTAPGTTLITIPDRTFELLTRVASDLLPEGEVYPVVPDAPDHAPSMIFQGLMDQFPKMHYDTLEQQLLKSGLLASDGRGIENNSLAARQGKPPLASSDVNLDRLDHEQSFSEGDEDGEALS